jgi:hypothetical protein
MNHMRPHDEIAKQDVAELCTRLLTEGTPSSAVVRALLHHAAALEKFHEPPRDLLNRMFNEPYYIALRRKRDRGSGD